jgi:hypothetical protein
VVEQLGSRVAAAYCPTELLGGQRVEAVVAMTGDPGREAEEEIFGCVESAQHEVFLSGELEGR